MNNKKNIERNIERNIKRNVKRNIRGNIIISILVVLVLTGLGLGVLEFSLFHNLIRGARVRKDSGCVRMRQELIYYLHHFRQKVFDGNQNIDTFSEPETGYFSSDYFPDITSPNDGKVFINHTFSHRVYSHDFFTRTRIISHIGSRLTGNSYTVRGEVVIDLLSGEIPLTMFPFFLDPEPGSGSPDHINLKEIGVHNTGDRPLIVSDVQAQMDTASYLMDCLDIKGTAFTWAQMREKFGFPVSDEPIHEGIHLLVEDGIVKCMFIQGDVDELMFSIEGNRQQFRVVRHAVPYDYGYIPGESGFAVNQREEPWEFAEVIVVNGTIWALGQEGGAAFTGAANITLYVSGETKIRTGLETERLDLKKVKPTGLTLVGKGITVDTPEEMQLEASIISDGKLVNKSSELKIEGSIYCKDIQNDGVIEIKHRRSGTDTGDFFRTLPFKTISRFHINAIEEV